MSLREGGLELLQLLEGESRPVPPLLPPHEGILADPVQRRVIGGVAGVCNEAERGRRERRVCLLLTRRYRASLKVNSSEL